ncbi:MAG: SprB repeat-containing protein, partial [Phycisphaerae bacterium]|nr:SprB repeat-containing protein [Saprospiraceae bacterium]
MRYSILLLLLCLIVGTPSAQAQCSADAAVTNVSCAGLSNGSIDLTASNGTAPYTFAWSNSQTDEDIAGLLAGTYTCTVTDALACTATVSAVVTESAPLFVSAVGGTLTCLVNSLTIQTNVNGGTTPYTYLWSNGATTADLQANQIGTYTVTVTDAHNCTATASPTLFIDADVPLACTAPPGILTCNVNTLQLDGGCSTLGPNIVYQWLGPGLIGQNNLPTVLVNQPGAYSLIVTNLENGCVSQATVFVAQDISTPVADAGADQVLTCASVAISLDGSGSSWGGGISPAWTTADGQIVAGANSLFPTIVGPGTYTLMIVNSQNGCTASDVVLVTADIAPPIADAGPDMGISCTGDPAILDASGSSVGAVYTYLWSGPGVFPGNESSLTPTVNLSGTYILWITNTTNGCTATDQVLVFPGPAIPEQDIAVDKVSCLSGDGAINLSFSDGVPPYAYLWSNGATTEDLNNLNAGMYSVTLTDATACSRYAVLTVATDPPISISSNISTPTSCAATDGSINILATGGIAPYSYLWSNGATTEDLADMQTGIYSVTVTDAVDCSKVLTVVLFTNL